MSNYKEQINQMMYLMPPCPMGALTGFGGLADALCDSVPHAALKNLRTFRAVISRKTWQSAVHGGIAEPTKRPQSFKTCYIFKLWSNAHKRSLTSLPVSMWIMFCDGPSNIHKNKYITSFMKKYGRETPFRLLISHKHQYKIKTNTSDQWSMAHIDSRCVVSYK